MQGCFKIIGFTLLSLSLLLTTGFKIIHPCYGLAVDEMRADLQMGVVIDCHRDVDRGCIPPSITKALIPSALHTYPRQTPQRKFDVSANQIPAKAFFMSLVEGTPYNMIVDPNINGFISIKLKNVSIPEVLEAVRDAYGYEFHANSYGYEVIPPKIETRIYTLNYLDVRRRGKSVTQVTSGQISEQVSSTSIGGSYIAPTPIATGGTQSTTAGSEIVTRSEANFWRDIEISLKSIVGNQYGRNVVVNPQSGVIIVNAYPPELKKVTYYLARVQNNIQRQVIIEAKVLEVELNDQFQSGIDWNLFGKVLTGNGGIGQTSFLQFPNTELTDFNSIFTIRANGNFGVLIKLLQTQGNVQVLSSPRISTMNNQKAVIKVGLDQFFVTGISTTNYATGTIANILPTQNITLTPFFSGVTLDVTPQISLDGEITLHIHPTVSDVKDQEKTIILGNSGLPNTQNTYVLPLAKSTIRESDNIVRARAGQVIVIGGLMQNAMAEEVAGVPCLSKIPFFGFLFRRTQQLGRKIELVILLRPLLSSNANWRYEMEKSDQRLCTMRRGFHENSLPEVFGNEGECNNC